MEGKSLTPREIAVLQFASEGDSAQDTAERTHLSEETIKGYRKRIVAKLAAKNTTHAVTIGFRRGLIHL